MKNVDSEQMQRNLAKMAQAVPGAIDRLLGKVAVAVVAAADPETPYDKGSLRAANAAKWHGGEQDPKPPPAGGEPPLPFGEKARPGEAIVYNSMSYAAAVHEDLAVHHDHGGAKFMENALMETGREEIVRALRDELLKEIAP